jgi:hypothetical protein
MGNGMQMKVYRIAKTEMAYRLEIRTHAGNVKRLGRATLTSHDCPL